LEVYVEGFSKRTGIAVAVSMPDMWVEIPRPAETALFRVVQEALANVHHHSGARRATVRLTTSAERLIIRVADDGHGMASPGRGESKAEGVGIPGMRVRLRQLGGDLKIHSTASGTLVRACLPIIREVQRAGD
jgi:two-component system NarL family sensor kinase